MVVTGDLEVLTVSEDGIRIYEFCHDAACANISQPQPRFAASKSALILIERIRASNWHAL